MVNELSKPISEIKTIFEAMFLERKLILNFLTFSKLLEETARIVCLLLALLRMRMIVLQKNDTSTTDFTHSDPTSLSRGETPTEMFRLGTNSTDKSNFTVRKNSHPFNENDQANITSQSST
jgi:hypothetical protein